MLEPHVFWNHKEKRGGRSSLRKKSCRTSSSNKPLSFLWFLCWEDVAIISPAPDSSSGFMITPDVYCQHLIPHPKTQEIKRFPVRTSITTEICRKEEIVNRHMRMYRFTKVLTYFIATCVGISSCTEFSDCGKIWRNIITFRKMTCCIMFTSSLWIQAIMKWKQSDQYPVMKAHVVLRSADYLKSKLILSPVSTERITWELECINR